MFLNMCPNKIFENETVIIIIGCICAGTVTSLNFASFICKRGIKKVFLSCNCYIFKCELVFLLTRESPHS